MPALQAPIYLDPWDKTQLEGYALLIDDIPDTPDKTYRGITCQRWLVRFQEDQQNTPRWLDYSDAEAYQVVGAALSIIQGQNQSCTLTLAHRLEYLFDGNVQSNYSAAYSCPTWRMPYAGRIRAIAAYSHTLTVVGTPPPVRIIPYVNNVALHQLIMTGSNVSNAHVHGMATDIDTAIFSAGTHLQVAAYSAVTTTDSLPLENIVAQVFVQFGTFT